MYSSNFNNFDIKFNLRIRPFQWWRKHQNRSNWWKITMNLNYHIKIVSLHKRVFGFFFIHVSYCSCHQSNPVAQSKAHLYVNPALQIVLPQPTEQRCWLTSFSINLQSCYSNWKQFQHEVWLQFSSHYDCLFQQHTHHTLPQTPIQSTQPCTTLKIRKQISHVQSHHKFTPIITSSFGLKVHKNSTHTTKIKPKTNHFCWLRDQNQSICHRIW